MKKELLTHLYDELKTLKDELVSHSLCNYERDNQNIKNLRAYVYLRTKDITKLQEELTSMGLSSLGRSQSFIISSINHDLIILSALLGLETNELENEDNFLDFKLSQKIMMEKNAIFGQSDGKLKTKVMVTLPSEAKDSSILIKNLIANGTSLLRINTAHDDVVAWEQMAKIIQEENLVQNKDTKIYVDLAGPKNRTGKIATDAHPFKIGSSKEAKKVEILPQSFQYSKTKHATKNTLATLVVDDFFYSIVLKSKHLMIQDLERNKKQTFKLVIEGKKVFAIVDKKIIIFPKTKIKLKNYGKKLASKLYNFELQPEAIRLFIGDTIIITPLDTIAGCSNYAYEGINYSAIISCNNKEIFSYVKVNDDIFIDDGKIGCKVAKHLPIGLECNIFLANENGTLLKEEKGINFPNTELKISAITIADKKNLNHIVKYADLIGISFAQSKDDIKELQNILEAKNKSHIAIVPKIETKLALKNLPQILEQLLQSEKCAIMIARGDLAIEVGFENLPYIQEEIFGICEAAHVPVIYATQILEGKMKNNLPSRAEVTDAANAQRADCVMLNKGPFVVDTIVSLKNILRQMDLLFQKNRQLLGICELWKSE